MRLIWPPNENLIKYGALFCTSALRCAQMYEEHLLKTNFIEVLEIPFARACAGLGAQTSTPQCNTGHGPRTL